jgi:anion-transporting  ArsA/GET3 family ATPase
MLPEPLPEQQTKDLLARLSDLGVDVAGVMINRVLLGETNCSRCASTQRWQRKTLERLRKAQTDRRIKSRGPALYLLPEQPEEVAGREALDRFTRHLYRLK